MNKKEYTREELRDNFEFKKNTKLEYEELLERVVTREYDGMTWSFIPHPIFDKL